MTLEKLKSSGTLSDKAYRVLKHNILNLEIKPGEILLEDQLSEKLGISRTPIREALKELKYEGLISYAQGKGTFVTELSTSYFLNVSAVRESLEMLSARTASLNRSGDDIKKLREILDEQRDQVHANPIDSRKYLEIDRKYHKTIALSTKNEVLVKYLKQINESFGRYLYYTKFEPRAMTVVTEHIEIVNSIENRDSVKSETLMKNHLQDVKESILLALVNPLM